MLVGNFKREIFMLTVREFRPDDAARVAQIMFESFKTFLGARMKQTEPSPPENYAHCYHRSTPLSESIGFVAETPEEGVVGFISISIDKPSGIGTLGVIGVDPACYARGTGSALFREAEKFWLEHGVRKAYTCTSSINERAQAYYFKQGFQVEGTRRDHFFPGVDELSLVKYYRDERPIDFQIRPFRNDDASAAAALVHSVNKAVLGGFCTDTAPMAAADFIAASAASNAFREIRSFVAVLPDSGEIIGVVSADVINDYGFGNLLRIAVRPDVCRHGIGKALFTEVENFWRERSLRKAVAACPAINCRTLDFLIARGMKIEETLLEHFRPGVDEHHLAKFFSVR